ncbi:MAG: glycosyltransferase family 39 protein, partial [Candidatus Eremiobacteraeota bacterium]|nr:glycosyltransferase family 39 protein [Candidatus Eremiobacteraeota bacterium]
MTPGRFFWIATAAFTAIGALLRLKGIHDPIFDHPGWRQGDTSAIARNFAQLQYNIFFPQTDYNGPPPNYVELELQIVPFLAATLYKLVGVHEVIGRLISLAFGIATIPVVAAFGRWLWKSDVAGFIAAATFAVLPGAWYYSHTFMPDTAMVFFTTCALFACARWIVDRDASWRGWWLPASLLMTAFLAKPVAVTAAIPIAACALARLGWRRALLTPQLWALFAVAFVPLALYDAFVSAHAEWHWASGITKLHVIPSLLAALTSPAAFVAKAVAFAYAFKLLAATMLGPVGFVLALAACVVPFRSRSDALVWGWLGGGLLYAYVVVTVERVDYYLYLLLPLGALLVGRLGDFALEGYAQTRRRRATLAAIAAAVWIVALIAGYREIAPYYRWSAPNYVRAKQLDATLAPGALIVMGHYDPSILYTINRKGWEEDPRLWTPFNEQSAIRKGARYYVSVEHARLKQT